MYFGFGQESPLIQYISIGLELYGYSNVTVSEGDKQHHGEKDAEQKRCQHPTLLSAIQNLKLIGFFSPASVTHARMPLWNDRIMLVSFSGQPI